MICVADSGSTKTDWVVVDPESGAQAEITTIGFNPFFINPAEIGQALQAAFGPAHQKNITRVHFYGAGCSSPERNNIISTGIKQVFSNAEVFVEHDLLAAARATCQFESGVACILGTGSNSCYYDGTVITDNVPSLGFILGDEGSGSALGRRLIQAFIYREMPPVLSQKFVETYHLDKETILDHVYKKPLPNRYLASFAPFCSDHISDPFIEALVNQTLEEFITRHVKKYPLLPTDKVGFVGSIAWTFREQVILLLHKHGLQEGVFIRKPIGHLVKYHVPGK